MIKIPKVLRRKYDQLLVKSSVPPKEYTAYNKGVKNKGVKSTLDSY